MPVGDSRRVGQQRPAENRGKQSVGLEENRLGHGLAQYCSGVLRPSQLTRAFVYCNPDTQIPRLAAPLGSADPGVAIRAIDIWRVDGDKLAQHRDVIDLGALEKQLRESRGRGARPPA